MNNFLEFNSRNEYFSPEFPISETSGGARLLGVPYPDFRRPEEGR